MSLHKITVRLDNGEEYPDFIAISGMSGGRWFGPSHLGPPVVEPARGDRLVELDGVLWMFDAVLAGKLAPQRMRDILAGFGTPPSGCCGHCDEIMDIWPARDAEHRARRARWEQWFATITAESHPCTLNGTETMIHTWDCHTVPELPPPVYSDRHDYARSHEAKGGDTGTSGARRVTAAEATAWAAKRRRPSRCKTCAPILPTATASEAGDVPSTR